MYGENDELDMYSLDDINKFIKYFKIKHLEILQELKEIKQSHAHDKQIESVMVSYVSDSPLISQPSRQSSQGNHSIQQTSSVNPEDLKRQIEVLEKKSDEIQQQIHTRKSYLSDQDRYHPLS